MCNSFAEMKRIYGFVFSDGKYSARAAVIIAGLPQPDFPSQTIRRHVRF
jgi:hypothetical protein